MIELNLGVSQGDVELYNFSNKIELIEFLKGMENEDCVWLATNEEHGVCGEIMVTEDFDKIVAALELEYWSESDDEEDQDFIFFVQKYNNYKAAYSVALVKQENRPKCYNPKRRALL